MTPSSKQIITEAHTRFNQLEDYGFDWSSFYNGYVEGRVAGLRSLKEASSENQYQRQLRILGRLVLRLLVDEKEWSEDVHQRIEDAAMDLLLLETDAEGNYKLIPHE